MRADFCVALLASATLLVGASGCGKHSGSGQAMLQNKGSDTMVNIAQALAESYRKVRPTLGIAVTGGGSGTGIAALINGTVDIANSSRDIKPKEREDAESKSKKKVVEHVVAFDALAVYVHPSNPMKQISREQLACIYGEGGTCAKWTDVGVEVPGCAGQEIVRVSRQSNSGTYAFFREWVLGEKKDFKLGSRDMQGSKDVVDLVAGTPCAIGYSGMGYNNATVKAMCVSKDGTAACVVPSMATALDKTYPIARALYMYTLGEPTGEAARYLDWIRSDEGQVIVEHAGFAPLPKDQRKPIPTN